MRTIDLQRFVCAVGFVAALLLTGCSATQPSAIVASGDGASTQPAVVNCLISKGWEVEARDDGGITAEYPTDQHDRYTEDVESCNSEHGLDRYAELTEAQYEHLYNALLESKKCLANNGYSTPPAPTFAAFVDSKGMWSPFAELDDISARDFTELERHCPQP